MFCKRHLPLGLVLLALPLGAAASECGEAAEAEILETTGDCPAALRLTGAPGEPISIEYGGLVARAEGLAARVRVFCSVRLKINVPAGFAAYVGAPEVKGRSEHAAVGSANLSVRWFETGSPGDGWFKRFAGDAAVSEFVETPANWPERLLGCGVSPELNVLVDATARVRAVADGEPTPVESIGVQYVKIPSITYKRCESPTDSRRIEP